MKNKRPNSWKRLIDALPHGVLIINGEGQIIYANASSAALFGTTRQKLIGTSFLYPLAAEETGEIEILRKDRTITSAQMTVREGAWQEEPAWIVALHDITELKDKEKRLSVVSKGVSSAFEGIVITDAQGTILEANQAFLNMSGFKKEDILGQNPRMWKSGKQDAQFYKHLWERLSSEGHWSGELWDKGGHNKLYPVFLSVSAVKNEAGDVTNYIGFFHDLTVIKQQEKQIEHVKYYDLLTGLPNKFLLTQKLEGFMRQASRQQKNLLVMNIRVFDPKTRKSSYEEPPHVRDAIIIHAVNRIKEVLRQRKMLARTGYSEFVGICLEQGDTVDNAAILAGQLIKSLSKPYHIENKTYRLKTHIGITAYEANSACHAEELLHQGEIARHKARQKGDNSFDFFDPQFEKSLLEFSRHLEAVRGALKKNQLRLFYQPKVDLLTGNVIGVEALLRWMHPVRGLLLPHQFLLRLDNHPISLELGEWTLNHALKMAGQFLSHDIEIPISINVGSHELQHKNYFHHFMTIMKKYPRIPKKMILLEVLETEAIEDLDLVSDLINRFKAQGIHFALDDFGKKYSSLAYLKELDTREVKLDQSFLYGISLINRRIWRFYFL
ncbi:EAL domain-containing protein [Legionella londiniensis]|uniref:Sensory box protein (GGDEF domain/EAL domain) n=1 Tax=Legionella londiniensis TaxID=45068 RepID=A0A0W0VPR6_9GAMM|nr:EAL domain-containing protein [Legionella londiniensis]KTD21769.1 sensory box protein (GGDEF domain/EAL domain) [Legionella londiniensis]STX92145.1 sensory box protein (GGDEF domain/EAL domain) [Legionella londiniensis]